MASSKQIAMQRILNALEELNQISMSESVLGTETNITRVDSSQRSLLNVIFANGYEIVLTPSGKRKIAVAKKKRTLI